MSTHSSVLAWRIPGTGEPGGLPSMRSHRVGQDWSDLAAAAAATVYIQVMELIIFTNFFFPFLHSLPPFLFLAFFFFHFMFLDLMLRLYNSKKKASSFKAFIPIFKLNCSLPDCPHLSKTPTHVWSNREKACTFILTLWGLVSPTELCRITACRSCSTSLHRTCSSSATVYAFILKCTAWELLKCTQRFMYMEQG